MAYNEAYKGSKEDILLKMAVFGVLVVGLAATVAVIAAFHIDESAERGEKLIGMKVDDAMYILIPLTFMTVFVVLSYRYMLGLKGRSAEVEGTIEKTWRQGGKNWSIVSYEVGGVKMEVSVRNEKSLEMMTLWVDPEDAKVVWADNKEWRSYHFGMLIGSFFLLPLLATMCSGV